MLWGLGGAEGCTKRERKWRESGREEREPEGPEEGREERGKEGMSMNEWMCVETLTGITSRYKQEKAKEDIFFCRYHSVPLRSPSMDWRPPLCQLLRAVATGRT